MVHLSKMYGEHSLSPVRGVGVIGFYRALHNYLRKWPTSRSATKSAVGNFYTRNFRRDLEAVQIMLYKKLRLPVSQTQDIMDYGIDVKVQHLRSVVNEYLQ